MSDSEREIMLELREVSLSFHTSKGTFDDGLHHVLDSVSFKLTAFLKTSDGRGTREKGWKDRVRGSFGWP